MSKILTIIAPKGYQDIEYNDPKEILIKEGHQIVTASTEKKAEGALGGTTDTDILLNDVKVNDYDAVIFVGGPGSVTYFTHQQALKIAKEFFNKGKLTCAICAAPGILAYAGVLTGKRATCHPSVADILIKNSIIYTASSVEKDGKIITAAGPSSAKDFGKVIAKNL